MHGNTELDDVINAILFKDINERQQQLWRETLAVFQGFELLRG